MAKIEPIPSSAYPHPKEIYSPSFHNFVAFDFETTGLSPAYDCIIEVGAVKVVNGEVVGQFQEFVRPYQKKVSAQITAITGICQSDVECAREMWEVIPDFLDFTDGFPLIGYNSSSFDIKFLERAGRYSHRYIENKHFDVMKYAKKVERKTLLNFTNHKLSTVSSTLHITNPQAHRALADAITTARVFVTLQRIENER